ncbi:MAG: D-2-hydroxyacid dehydrogenase [Chloroflexi bacterium]|nr:D-2-hydroxyacid dehydrogenase [Chloroflexota bacterium]
MGGDIHLLISARFDVEELDRIRGVSPRYVVHGGPGGIALQPPNAAEVQEITYPVWHPDLDLEALIRQAEVVVGYRFPPDLVDRAPKLRWMQCTSAGAERVLTPKIVEADVVVTNIGGVHPVPLAEIVLSHMLLFAKQWPRLIEQQRERRWNKLVLDELNGKTVTIVGFGRIGQEIARVCRCLRMRVVGVRRSGPAEGLGGADEVYGRDGLLEAVGRADFVVSILPLAADNRGYVGEAVFRAMKPTAVFINVGRGPTVRQDALIRALQEGWIGGAALDVFEVEPLPADNPLWGMPNVVLTPHMAADTHRYKERVLEIFCENLRRYAAGEPLINVVDKRLGY